MIHLFSQKKELRRSGVPFVVAPYEADAQMAYLDRTGQVAAVISEDSDLVLFGCQRILYKLDHSGYTEEVCLGRLGNLTEMDLVGWSLGSFRQVCILSGCDYLPSVAGMGLKTAWRLFQRHGRQVDLVLRALRLEYGHRQVQPIPSDYEERFRQAELTFLHQVVYDGATESLVHLNPIEEVFRLASGISDWDFCGR